MMRECYHADCADGSAHAVWYQSDSRHRLYCDGHYRDLVAWKVPMQRVRVVG